MNEWRTWYTSRGRGDMEEGQGGGECVVGFAARVHDVDLHGIVRCVHTSAHGTGMATLFGLHYPSDRLGNYVWE